MKHHHSHKPLSEILPDEPLESAKAIRKAVKIGCVVNALLMGLKLTAGYLGNSDALVADGYHSLYDVGADLIMLLFVGLSYRAADSRYAYGYGKFETFSSFLMCSLLMVISIFIGIEGIESIIEYAHGATLKQPDIWTFIVVLVSMAGKEGLFRFYHHVGEKNGSKAMMANAWHHRGDAFASVATLIGVTFAHFFGPAFRILDPIASIVIALVIFIPAIRLLLPSFAELMERSLPFRQVEKAREVIQGVPGVLQLKSLRTRRNGHVLVFDTEIRIAAGSTVEQGEVVTEAIREALKQAFCPHILLSVTTTSR